MFPLHCIPKKFCTQTASTEGCAKFFPYDQKLIHNTLPSVTKRQTDGWTTDKNGTIDAYSIARQKIVYSIGLIINVREQKFHADF